MVRGAAETTAKTLIAVGRFTGPGRPWRRRSGRGISGAPCWLPLATALLYRGQWSQPIAKLDAALQPLVAAAERCASACGLPMARGVPATPLVLRPRPPARQLSQPVGRTGQVATRRVL